MHTATRLALPVIDRIRALNPAAHICAYGLYAPLNAGILRERGAQTILGPEFEGDLTDLAMSLPIGITRRPDLKAGVAADRCPRRLHHARPHRICRR